MDNATAVLGNTEEAVVLLGGKHPPRLEDSCAGVLATKSNVTDGGGDKRGLAAQPLRRHQQRRGPGEPGQRHGVDTQTPTDGSGRNTSVPQERESDGAGEPPPAGSGGVSGEGSSGKGSSGEGSSGEGSNGEVSSGDGAWAECPVCGEPFRSRGERRAALLNCDHALCHRCLSAILARARDPSRVQCPLCRQTTPLPRWEIQRLQEEAYGNSVREPGPGAGPDPWPPAVLAVLAVPAPRAGCCCVEYARRRLGRPCPPYRATVLRHNLCCWSTAVVLVLLFLVLIPWLYLSTHYS